MLLRRGHNDQNCEKYHGNNEKSETFLPVMKPGQPPICQINDAWDQAYPKSKRKKAFPVTVRERGACQRSLTKIQNCGCQDKEGDNYWKGKDANERKQYAAEHAFEFKSAIGKFFIQGTILPSRH
jgi:hypothetical protein